MFECIEVPDQLYKSVTTSKTNNMEESNHTRHVSKFKGVEYSSPTNPKRAALSIARKLCRPSNQLDGWSKNMLDVCPQALHRVV